MSNVEVMSQAVDYIEDNLKEPITVADMAAAVSFSLYHFCRTFNQASHHTPYDYLMRRRLSESAHDLIHTDKKIIEIACDYQFNNPETFSRAFRRMFEMQPNQARKQGKLGPWRSMPRLTLAHLRHIAKGDCLRPVLEDKGAFQVAGLMTLVKSDPAVIPELWELLAPGLNSTGPKDRYGVAYYPDDWPERGFWYMAGIAVHPSDTLDTAWVIKDIPALKYARFIHKGSRQELQLTLDYIFHTWLPQSGHHLVSPLMIEHYGHNFGGLESAESETRIYVPVQENDL
jgi:AraC family transcriptional regulator